MSKLRSNSELGTLARLRRMSAEELETLIAGYSADPAALAIFGVECAVNGRSKAAADATSAHRSAHERLSSGVGTSLDELHEAERVLRAARLMLADTMDASLRVHRGPEGPEGLEYAEFGMELLETLHAAALERQGSLQDVAEPQI